MSDTPTSQQVVPLKAGGAIAPIIPRNIDEVFRLAQVIAKSGLAPRDMSTPEQVTVAILTGMEIGLPPMFAIQKIAVINGRPALWGDALPAILLSRGFKLREHMEGIGDARVAHCEVVRPDGEKTARTFSVADAKEAALWGKSGPWKSYPARMLQMRARGFACRDGAADALSGLYLREELEEPMQDITPRQPMLDIPDVPDAPDVPAITPPDDVSQDAPITDVAGFMARLAEERALCTSAEDVAELADANADLVSRLPARDRMKAAKILSVEAAE